MLVLSGLWALNVWALTPKASPPPPVKGMTLAVMRAPSYKSYKQWKTEQISYWQSKGKPDMGDDLTVADYFAGYLTKQKDQASAIREVSGRLSPDEVAELMMIYANSVFGTHPSQIPARADVVKP